MSSSTVSDLIVSALSHRASTGWLKCGQLMLPCALGRSGCGVFKREGDGITPIGRWAIRGIRFRPDRRTPFARPPIRNATAIAPDDGWCDSVADVNYNRPVRHPYPAGAEHLWREDHLYNIVVLLSHNHLPRIQGHGSAIFMHIADQDEHGALQSTAGCIALKRRDLHTVLAAIGRATHVRVR